MLSPIRTMSFIKGIEAYQATSGAACGVSVEITKFAIQALDCGLS
jgi:hypothetical protein